MQHMGKKIKSITETVTREPGFFRVVHANLSLLRIILLIGILIISLILVIS